MAPAGTVNNPKFINPFATTSLAACPGRLKRLPLPRWPLFPPLVHYTHIVYLFVFPFENFPLAGIVLG